MQTVGPGVPAGDMLENLPASTTASIATNLLQVGVISSFRQRNNFRGKEVTQVDDATLEKELGVLVAHTNIISELARATNRTFVFIPNEAAEIICSPLMMLYAVVAAMMLRDSMLWTPQTDNELVELFQRRQSSITSYDQWRFKMLLEFAKTLLPPAR